MEDVTHTACHPHNVRCGLSTSPLAIDPPFMWANVSVCLHIMCPGLNP